MELTRKLVVLLRIAVFLVLLGLAVFAYLVDGLVDAGLKGWVACTLA